MNMYEVQYLTRNYETKKNKSQFMNVERLQYLVQVYRHIFQIIFINHKNMFSIDQNEIIFRSMKAKPSESSQGFKTVGNFTILLFLKDDKLTLRAFRNDNKEIYFANAYDHDQLPIPFKSCFANVAQLFKELIACKEDRIQFNQKADKGELKYILQMASKKLEMSIDLSGSTITRDEQLQCQNFLLKNRVMSLEKTNTKLEEKIKQQNAKIIQLEKKYSYLKTQRQLNIANNQKQKILMDEQEPEGAKRGNFFKWGEAGLGRKIFKLNQRPKIQIKLIEQFNFQMDSEHPNFKKFEFLNNRLKFISNDQWADRSNLFQIVSGASFSTKGRTVIGIKLIQDSPSPIYFGLVAQSRKNEPLVIKSNNLAMAYNLKGGMGCLSQNGIVVNESLNGLGLKQTLHLAVCHSRNIIEWFYNYERIFSHPLQCPFIEEDLCPFVCMSIAGEQIQFL